MTVFNKRQQNIAKQIDDTVDRTGWKDWRWQVQHSIRSTEAAERLLGIRFTERDRKAFRQTAAKFPDTQAAPGMLLQAADIYRGKLDQPDRAAELLRAVIERYPEHAGVGRARDILESLAE